MAVSKNQEKTRRLVGLAMLSAIIIVLQIICTFIKFGPFTITLALTPIFIGAALYGAWSGAYLGALLGVVIFLAGLFGWDPATLGLINLNAWSPLFVLVICVLKTAVAGFTAGIVYKAMASKNELAATITASVLCPIVNTALFLVGMFAFFMPTLQAGAAADGKTVIAYAIVGLVGLNFIVEFITVIVLSVAVARIIKAVGKK
ncbi:MAG: ECF transporter S component [Clostridia bacterium]|nr:ECF transporter S component [Clostridia bacterium]